MDQRTVLLAFTAGMVATVNPCGFAMLPAYLSYFLGMEDRSGSPRAGVYRALAVGLAVSAGFMTVFFLIGVPFAGLYRTTDLGLRLPWVTLVVGLGLAALGVAMLRGFEPAIRLPKMSRGTGSRELPTMFLFGVSYAVSSLSCTIPLFMTLVASSFVARDATGGMAAFLAYGAGMALVLMALTLAIALARQGLVHSLRRLLPAIHRIAGALLIVAGLYVAYFGWYEARLLAGDQPGGPGDAASAANDALRRWIVESGATRVGLVLLAAIVLAVLVATGWRSAGSRGQPGP
jgi:cytochrome c-type biogenesis protein